VGEENGRLLPCLGNDRERTSACRLAVTCCNLLSWFLSGLSRLEDSYFLLSGGRMGKISKVSSVGRFGRSAPIPAFLTQYVLNRLVRRSEGLRHL